jgi:predicted phosphoribosyltransferase
MAFANRVEAGRRLAVALRQYRKDRPVVLALPRGGVPVGVEIAASLDAPLELLLVRKVGVRSQPELAMGAVAEGNPPIIVRNEPVISTNCKSEADFQHACRAEFAEIARRRKVYLGDRPPAEIAGRTVIVVDDGIATGATMRAALQAARARNPKRLVLGVPVGAGDALIELQTQVDDLVCLDTRYDFASIGAYYDEYNQLTDDEVIGLLKIPRAPSVGGAAE